MKKISKGFIKLDRSILDWEWYDDNSTFRVFIHLLLSAQWEDKEYHGIELPRGSLLTSLQGISKATNLTIAQVRTGLNHLKKTQEITCKSTRAYTIITINSWDFYQGVEQTNSKPTANEQHTDYTQTANEQQHTRNKEIKKQRSKESSPLRRRNSGGNEQSYDIELFEQRAMNTIPEYRKKPTEL